MVGERRGLCAARVGKITRKNPFLLDGYRRNEFETGQCVEKPAGLEDNYFFLVVYFTQIIGYVKTG